MTTNQATYPPSKSGFQLQEIRTIADGNHEFVVANLPNQNPKTFKVFYEDGDFHRGSDDWWSPEVRDELTEYLSQFLPTR